MPGWAATVTMSWRRRCWIRLEQKFGPLAQCRAVNYAGAISAAHTVGLDDVRCAASATDRGRGHFLTDETGAAPYRPAALMSRTNIPTAEVISGAQLSTEVNRISREARWRSGVSPGDRQRGRGR